MDYGLRATDYRRRGYSLRGQLDSVASRATMTAVALEDRGVSELRSAPS
jgi:hypothetical protein